MENPQSTIKTLRELNSDLVHQIAELRKKFAEVEAENIEVKAENAKEQSSQGANTNNSQNSISLLVPILPEINSDNTSIKDISSHTDVNRLKAKSQPDEEEAIPDPIPKTEHSSTQSESLAKPKTLSITIQLRP
ncbi:12438_t:CDS:2 [Ambispora gerdemannii]|uniref:12438_t:CDS:1 n=1 Tax=Ambispora gerdemannii TaxID=144530 RepID=A0A9N9FJN7_9GLOM|nr:12438_t:CDS:2 [Ambispora gerdemannii]